MFKRYQYTCPDVIHQNKIRKINAYASIAVNVLFFGGLWLAGQTQTKKYNAAHVETPVE